MQSRVFRGAGAWAGVARVASVGTLYVGGFAVLWGLGLVVRGWQGWFLLSAPFAAWVAAQLWAYRRVGVHVHEGVLRYEGASPARDFEVALDALDAAYFDDTLPGAPLVLVHGREERVCGELAASASRALAAHLAEMGVRSIR